jgi:hypothetical protein
VTRPFREVSTFSVISEHILARDRSHVIITDVEEGSVEEMNYKDIKGLMRGS